MKFKLLILMAVLGSIGASNAGCSLGICTLKKRVYPVYRFHRVYRVPSRVQHLKKIAAYRILHPKDRVITGYKVNSSNVSLMIHLPERNPQLFSMKQKYVGSKYYNRRFSADGFTTQIRYGGDIINLSVQKGKFVNLSIRDYKGRNHNITSTIPHQVKNLNGKVQVKLYRNVVEINMPRF